MPKNTVNNRIKKYILIFIILFIVTMAIYILYAYGPVIRSVLYKQLDKFHLIPKPERFTELYFENHTDIPKEMAKGKTILFSFTIHNLEGKDMEYPYAVYFKNNYGTTTVEKNIALVKDNEYKTITESYTFKSMSKGETLYVELTDQHQELHFALSSANK